MGKLVSHGAVAVVALVIGVLVGSVMSSTEPDTTTEVAETASAESASEASPTERVARGTEREPTVAAEDSADGSETSGTAAGVQDIAALDASLTDDERAMLSETLREHRLRRVEEQRLAEELARIAATRSEQDGLTVLDAYLRGVVEGDETVASYASMRSHIRTAAEPVETVTATGARTPFDLSTIQEGATVLEFGPGTFVLDRGTSGWNVPSKGLETLEIRGAGMDRTTLIGPDWAFLMAPQDTQIENLVIRDLTIDGGEKKQSLLQSRGGMSVALERVRLRDWVVAGHAAAIGVSGDAFIAAKDSSFEGEGWALSLRGPAMAVFEGCTFRGSTAVLIASDHRSGRPALVRLLDCDFGSVRLADRNLRTRGDGGALVDIVGGTAQVGPSSWTRGRRIDAFGAAEARSVQGLELKSAPAVFPPRAAADFLRRAEATGLRAITGFTRKSGVGRPLEVDVRLASTTPDGDPEFVTLVEENGVLVEQKRSPSRRRPYDPTVDDLARVRSIADLIDGAGLAPDADLKSAMMIVAPSADETGPTQHVGCNLTLVGNDQVGIDATTGEVTSRR